MNKLAINSGGAGLGAVSPLTPAVPDTQSVTISPGTIGLCNSWAYWFTIPCWQLSPSAWAQAAALPPIPASVVAGPAAPSNLITPGSDLPGNAGQQAQGAVDQLAGSAVTQTQPNVQDFIDNNVPDTPLGSDSCENFTANWPAPFDGLTCPTVLIYGAVGVAAILIFNRLLGKI